MRFWRMALRNLSRRPIRSTLSILGIALSVMLILSVGVSSVQYATLVRESRLLYGDRLIVVSKNAYFAEAVPIGSSLSNTTATVVSRLPGVAHAAPILSIFNLQGIVPTNITFAVPPGEWDNIFENLQVAAGLLPQQDNEAAIGSLLASNNQLHPGSSIKILSSSLNVSGVLIKSQSPVVDNSVFITLAMGQKIYGYQGLISMIAVTPTFGANQAKLQSDIKQALVGVTVLTEQQRGADAEPLLQQFVAWSQGVEIVAFGLSILFVTTLSLINVFERRREFAAAYAMGATRLTLLRFAVLENGLVGTIGALIGTLLGIIVSIAVSQTFGLTSLTQNLAYIPNIIPPAATLEVILATILVSSITGGLVFLATMKRDIATILRYEA